MTKLPLAFYLWTVGSHRSEQMTARGTTDAVTLSVKQNCPLLWVALGSLTRLTAFEWWRFWRLLAKNNSLFLKRSGRLVPPWATERYRDERLYTVHAKGAVHVKTRMPEKQQMVKHKARIQKSKQCLWTLLKVSIGKLGGLSRSSVILFDELN